jgi:hypothetical protein
VATQQGQCVYVVFMCEVTRLYVFDHFISIRSLSHRLAMGKRKCVFNVNLQQEYKFLKLCNDRNNERVIAHYVLENFLLHIKERVILKTM